MSPEADALAYVWPIWTDIHINPGFWRQGSRQQWGILAHEISHEYMGTEDHGYVTGWPTLPPIGVSPTYEEDGNPVNVDSDELVENADTYEGLLEQCY